jgi:hypothetical protein
VESPEDQKAPPAGPDLPRLVAYSLVTGLCPLIPIPFLDDWARDLLRRRHTAGIATAHGLPLDEDALSVLALGSPAFKVSGCFKGCLVGAGFKFALYVVRKLFMKAFRTVVILLTFRSCSREFSRTFHEAFLFDHALRLGALPPPKEGTDPRPRIGAVRRAIEATCAEVDTSPITRIARATLLGSRGVFRHAGRTLSRQVRSLRRRRAAEKEISRQLDLEGEEELGRLIDSLTIEVGKETAYLEGLRERLGERLAADPNIPVKTGLQPSHPTPTPSPYSES